MTVGRRRHDAGTALGTAVPGSGPAPEIRVCEALAPVVRAMLETKETSRG